MNGCACINVIKKGPNGRCSKDVTPKSKPKLVKKKGLKGR
jgi:hypothetical protein